MLDWRQTKVYTDYVVKKVNNRLAFENLENNLLREDEIEYVKIMIFKKVKESKNQASSEVVKMCTAII